MAKRLQLSINKLKKILAKRQKLKKNKARGLKARKSQNHRSQFQLSFSQMRQLKLLKFDDQKNSKDFVSTANERSQLNRACKTKNSEISLYDRYTGN